MANKQGPPDLDFNNDQMIMVIKSLKSNNANFGVLTNEIFRCSPSAIAKPLSLVISSISYLEPGFFLVHGTSH